MTTPAEGPEKSLGDVFLGACCRFPERTFIRHIDGTVLTYSDALIRVAEISLNLQKYGTRRGDRILCYLESIFESVLFDLASMVSGVVPVPLSPIFSTAYM